MNNFNHLQMLIKKAILYKRRHLKEDGEIVKKERKLPTSKNKKTELKKIYKKILTGTPYEENIPVFMQLIDASPDSYINYEMGINLENAMGMVDELIKGSGDFTTDELKNIVNITRGVGFPAIEHYAAGGKAMPKETQVFGAHHMDQNVNELMGSIKQRKDPSRQLPAPEKKELGTTMPDTIHREVLVKKFDSRLAKIIGFPNVKNTEFGNIASKMKSSGMNTNRMASAIAKIILGSTSYEEAKKEAEQKLHLDFDKGEDLFRSMWKEKARQEDKVKIKREEKFMKLRNFLREMALPTVGNQQEATKYIEAAYMAATKGPMDQDVMGGLHAAATWLQQQPNVGTDPIMINLSKKAKIAKQKLDADRSKFSPNQARNTTVKNVERTWG